MADACRHEPTPEHPVRVFGCEHHHIEWCQRCGALREPGCAWQLPGTRPIPKPWGVFDVDQGRWWPRRFASREEAQAHYDRCKGPGSRGEPRHLDEMANDRHEGETE